MKKKVKSLALIILGVMAFRSILFEPFRIPSGSMIPTLMVGDFIFVNKFAYGLKVPFSDLSIKSLGINFEPIYLFGKKNPRRGDVVVFKYPKDPSVFYVKRLVGLPGDTFEIVDKGVFINGEEVGRAKIDGASIMADMDEAFKKYNLSFYRVKMGEREYTIQLNDDSYYKSHHRETKIPPGKFFVLGDNRDFSHDSRFWGLISHKHLKGRASFVWLSLIIPFGLHNIFKFRYWRIGKLVN